MTARFVNGRILIEGDEREEDHPDKQMATTITRNKFHQLSQQYQEDEHTRRWGEHKPRKSMAFSKMIQEGIGPDSESEYEPEDDVTSLSVGMIPEFIFNIMIFLKICVGFYIFGTGLSAMRWNASIQSFVNPHDDSDFDESTKIQRPVEHLDFEQSGIQGIKVKYVSNGLTWLGVAIMAVSIADIVFCLLLWHAVFNYMKQKIIIFCLLLVTIELFFISVAWFIHALASCNTDVILQFLNKYLDSFGTDKLSTRKVNEVQFNLGCCGENSWLDYIKLKNGGNATHFYHQYNQALVPYSCCRFPWSAHLFCGFEAEKWASDVKHYHNDIQNRFYTVGCKKRIQTLCNRIVAMLSIHMELAYATFALLNIFICLMVYFITQKINLMRLEAESLYDFNKLEIIDNAFESDDSAEFDKFSDEEATGGGDTNTNPIPTLKEIYQQMNAIESRGVGVDTKAQLREMVDQYQKSTHKPEKGVETNPDAEKTSVPPPAHLQHGDTAAQPQAPVAPSPKSPAAISPQNVPKTSPDQKQPKKTEPPASKSPSTSGGGLQKDFNPRQIQTQTPTPYNDQLTKLVDKSKQQKKIPDPPNVHKKQPMEFSFGQRKIAK